MQVTGYMLREALRQWKTKREVADKQFKDSLWQFEGEQGMSPQDLSTTFEQADSSVAMLEECQQRYNLFVTVVVQGTKMTLCQAVKRIGGAGRQEKMWRSAALDTGRDRYDSRRTTRNKDDVSAERQVSMQESMRLADQKAKYAGALRAAIATANATEIEMLDVSPDLFKDD